MLCFGIAIFWLGGRNCVAKNENGSYFPNTLIQTLSWYFFQLVWVILDVLFDTPNISMTFYLEIAIFCEN